MGGEVDRITHGGECGERQDGVIERRCRVNKKVNLPGFFSRPRRDDAKAIHKEIAEDNTTHALETWTITRCRYDRALGGEHAAWVKLDAAIERTCKLAGGMGSFMQPLLGAWMEYERARKELLKSEFQKMRAQREADYILYRHTERSITGERVQGDRRKAGTQTTKEKAERRQIRIIKAFNKLREDYPENKKTWILYIMQTTNILPKGKGYGIRTIKEATKALK
jgi:hypothetical protein